VRKSFLILSLALLSSSAFAVTPELHGYMRAGTGTNGKGGKQECIMNAGMPGNPMRLGNECSIYGETALTAPITKGGTDEPFFLSSVRMAYFPPGDKLFEDDDSDKRDINIVEAFVEGGKFQGSPLTYWAGKRFYRDVDVLIDDWYYYADMSGNGGGVGNIPLLGGTVAVAALLQTGSTRTNVGLNQAQVLDLRWQQIPLSDTDQLNFWAAFGKAPAGRDAQNREYKAREGWLAGARWRKNFWDGFNDLSIIHGEKLLESISLWGNAALLDDGQAPGRADRWRVVENMNVQPGRQLGLHLALAAEYWDPRVPGTDKRGHFYTAAVRPIYYFNKNWQVALEAGRSVIETNGERNADGSPTGARNLTRFTIAPAVALDAKLFARPVIRLFYSYSFWNEANKASVGQNAPSYANATAGQNYGIQTEVWF
jgi:maltoporin